MKTKSKMFLGAGVAVLLLLASVFSLRAQALTTTVCKGETICHAIGAHRGIINWQQSPDGLNWVLVPFQSADTFCMTADTSGYYRAMVQEGTCAPVYTDVQQVLIDEVVADAGPDGFACNGAGATIGGNPAALSGIAPFAYAWSPGNDLSASNIANPVATPLSMTTYLLVVTDSLGCMGMDSVVISPSAAVLADAGPDLGICLGSSIAIGGSPAGSGGTGPLTYLWAPATHLSSATASNPMSSPIGPTTYLLTVTDSLGCFAMDTMVVDTGGQLVPDSITFSYTGAVQTFVVPGCVDSIFMDVYGAQGGANWVNNVNFGGRVRAKLAVTPGETLKVYVGQQPTVGTTAGWNGGGAGDGAGKGGGGASDVRRGAATLNDRIIVAGGGGGAGYWSSLHVVGGVGGGLVGGSGYRDPGYTSNPGGLGGTQTAGGANGTCISLYNTQMAGSFGQGASATPFGCGCEGYGAGGGWYGGASSGNCRGAGGGSSYTLPAATNVVHNQGVRPGNGLVKFVW